MGSYRPAIDELTKMERLQLKNQPSSNASQDTSSSGLELIDADLTRVGQNKSVHLPCYLLDEEPENKDFCGREDILDLLAKELLPSKESPSTSLKQFALCGFGGIGKTEIARKFCQHYKSSFDAVFWVVADEVTKLDYAYQQISLALGLEDPSGSKGHMTREKVKNWLSQSRKSSHESEDGQPGSEATWLLVFDNADDPVILADFWPKRNGSILITSRNPLAKTIFTQEDSGADIAPLSLQDGARLFKHLSATTRESDADAVRISESLGGIPFAIYQMAAIVKQENLSLAEFLELYADLEQRPALYQVVVCYGFGYDLASYPHAISTVWEFEKLDPYAWKLLELMSFLGPDAVEERLLIEASTELLADWAPRFNESRLGLVGSSLVQRNKQKRLLSTHRVVQDVVLATMDAKKKQSMFDRIVRLLWSEWPAALPKPSKEPELPQPKSRGGRLHVGRWPACAAIYPHVLRIHQLWPNLSSGTADSSMLFAKLLSEAAWYQKERGKMKDSDGFFKTARSICDASAHPDRDAVLADIYFSLGSIAMDSNNFDDSRKYKELSLDLVEKICKELGTVDERLYLAYAERGVSRIQDKRYEEGEADLKYALEIRKSLGNYIPRSGEANLGWALLAQGKLEECKALLWESLAGRERALGSNDSESARTGLLLYALGNLRAVQGEWGDSFDYHESSWHHMIKTVGERDLYTASITHKMAEHLMRMGQHEGAISMINAALDIWSVDPDTHKNEIGRSTFLKGKVFEAMGRDKKAYIAFRVATRLFNEVTQQKRQVGTLTAADFDEIVAFWSR